MTDLKVDEEVFSRRLKQLYAAWEVTNQSNHLGCLLTSSSLYFKAQRLRQPCSTAHLMVQPATRILGSEAEITLVNTASHNQPTSHNEAQCVEASE